MTTKNEDTPSFPKPWHCQIVDTFGIHDEVATAPKRFSGSSTMARCNSMRSASSPAASTPTVSVVKDIFHRHRIPLAGAIEEPSGQSPLTKAVILLQNLPAKDFLRGQVIDLLSSPYFQIENSARDRSPPRPDLWDLATRELAICKGVAEWRRLRSYHHRDLQLQQISDDDEPRKIRIPAEQLASLADIVETLIADLMRLPPQASWQDYVVAWKNC